MRAAILTEAGKPLSVETVEPLPLGDNDVLVSVAASGICHTDLLRVRGDAPIDCPAILGHEGAGTVVEVGRLVRRARVGDRVVGSWVPTCGTCFWCASAQSNLCERFGSTGSTPRVTRDDGSVAAAFCGLGTFAEAMVVHEDAVCPVETDLPFDQLALIGCAVMTGVGAAINTARVKPGSAVAVVGCGGIGQSIVQGARIAGAAAIIAIDPVQLKRDTASRLGATASADPGSVAAVEAVRELTGGRGADYVFEASGRPDMLVPAFEMTRRGGAIVMVGVQPPGTTFPWTAGDLMLSERRILGCLYGSCDVRRDVPLLVRLAEAGRLDLSSMVSTRIALDDINEGLEAIVRGEVIRSVIVN